MENPVGLKCFQKKEIFIQADILDQFGKITHECIGINLECLTGTENTVVQKLKWLITVQPQFDTNQVCAFLMIFSFGKMHPIR